MEVFGEVAESHDCSLSFCGKKNVLQNKEALRPEGFYKEREKKEKAERKWSDSFKIMLGKMFFWDLRVSYLIAHVITLKILCCENAVQS